MKNDGAWGWSARVKCGQCIFSDTSNRKSDGKIYCSLRRTYVEPGDACKEGDNGKN